MSFPAPREIAKLRKLLADAVARPWELTASGRYGEGRTFVVLDANGVAVCDCGPYDNDEDPGDPDPAGSLLVAAVNALEGLLDAVECSRDDCRVLQEQVLQVQALAQETDAKLKQTEEQRAELVRVIAEANENAPHALVDALDSLTRTAVRAQLAEADLARVRELCGRAVKSIDGHGFLKGRLLHELRCAATGETP